MPPLCCKTCAVRPVFAQVVRELRAADPSNVQGPVKQNASPGEQSEALRRRWKRGQEQNPGPENQDSQHMLEQRRGQIPDDPPERQLKKREGVPETGTKPLKALRDIRPLIEALRVLEKHPRL